jgi:aminoglycoside 6'-N-acetyltransferase
MTLSLRPMTEDDLPLLVSWFQQPHVYRWWRTMSDLEQTRAKYLPRLHGERPTAMITVLDDDVPIGLAQWYQWDDYAEDRDNYRIGTGELGIDYTIGALASCRRGLGTQMIALLLGLLGEQFPTGTAISVTPEADNVQSCSRRTGSPSSTCSSPGTCLAG